ncbi:NHL repeat-containing protein [Mycobacterium sp. URHB0044]|jgi:streptogramin lyase|uniref:NHL repeat-containing protein n=1 Tax=Mycobacterium sp. URHB0044 TaxID=1380386 RepID=UPI000688A5D2|nr:NHL repeat-containing protein [Mycobacterium sp. URHB0044]
MSNRLIDQDDPEKRAADLEHQFSESKRGVDLSQAAPPGEATARRFVAFAAPPTAKQMMKYVYLLTALATASLAAINMALLLGGSILGSERVWQDGGAVVLVAVMLLARPAYSAFQRRMYRGKKILVDVGSDDLTMHTRPGEVFSFVDAQVGRWVLPGYGGATRGTALHLRCGEHRFVLGGRDHRAANGTPLEAAPVDTVDAWMWAPDFDELLAIVCAPGRSDAHGSTPGQPTRCLLLPNPMTMFSFSFVGMFKNTATALRMSANPPLPSMAIEVGNQAISVIDLKSNAIITSASPSQVTATPAESSRWMPKMGKQTTPVLVVEIPDMEPLTIGCAEFTEPPQATWSRKTKLWNRFTWRGKVHAVPEPAFVVSDVDWLTLVEKFGLMPYLEDSAKSTAVAEGTAVTKPTRLSLARPKRKLWIYVVILAVIMFVGSQAMLSVAERITYNRQLKVNQLTADRLRQFALPFTDLRLPHGVAVDGDGNVYVTETRTNRVLKLATGSSTQTVLPFTGLDLSDGSVVDSDTAGIAVDPAGDVYVTDTGHDRVVKLANGSSTQTVLPFRNLNVPKGVAVDAAGAVYVVDYFYGRIVKLPAGSSTQTSLPKTGGGSLGDVAVDTTGTVYANAFRCSGKSSCSSRLLKLAAGSNTWTTLPSAAPSQTSVTVDITGNLYVLALGDTGGVMKLTPGSDNWTELPGAHRFVDPMGLAVDTRGNVYVTDHAGSRAPGGGSFFGLWQPKDDAEGYVVKLPAG